MTNNVRQKADARLAVRLPSAVLDRVSRAADADGRTVSAMAVRLMQMGLDRVSRAADADGRTVSAMAVRLMQMGPAALDVGGRLSV